MLVGTTWTTWRSHRSNRIDADEEKIRFGKGTRDGWREKKEKRNNGGIVFGWSVHGEESANHSVGNRIPGSKGWFDESRGWFSTARCWPTLLGEGKGNDSGRAPALSRPVKALTRLHEFLFFLFYFSFFFLLTDNRPRLPYRPSLGDEAPPLHAYNVWNFVWAETGAGHRVR